MKKIALLINFILVVGILLSIIPTAKIRAENASWKLTLADFLMNNFPSLFDEATQKKNNEMFEKWENNSNYIPDPSNIPIDALDKWNGKNPYYPLLLPLQYEFYDLDNDGIPEVIITYPTSWAEERYHFVYQLNGNKYELIYSEYQSVYFYTNAYNNLVMCEGFYTTFYAVYFAEIKNGELKLSNYIDSNSSDMYNGFKYNYLGGDFSHPHEDGSIVTYQAGVDISILGEIIEADALTPLLPFDCSDVVDSLKYVSISPKTGNSNTTIFIVFGLISVVFIFALSRKGSI